MSETREPHPLDDFEFSPQPDEASRTPVHRPLLKLSVWLIAGSFAVLLISAIATSLAPPSSGYESFSSGVYRASGLVLLVGFLGILAAYRIPQLKQLSMDSGGWRQRVSGLGLLIIINVVGFFLVGAGLGLASDDPRIAMWGLSIYLGLLVIFAGLMVTVAIEHQGFMRAYAAGVLTALVLMAWISGNGLIYVIGGGRINPRMSMVPLLVPLGVALTSGLVSAAYSTAMASYRKRSEK